MEDTEAVVADQEALTGEVVVSGQTLEELESEIEEGFKLARQGFLQIGRALGKIQEGGLYSGPWHIYLQKRWGLERSDAYRHIDAALSHERLERLGLPIPSSMRALADLAQIEDDEDLKLVVEAAAELAERDGALGIRIDDETKARRMLASGKLGEDASASSGDSGDASALPAYHGEPSTEGFLESYRSANGTTNASFGDRSAGTQTIDPADVGVLDNTGDDDEEEFWRDGDHREATLIAVPHSFDEVEDYVTGSLDHELEHYTTPVGQSGVKETGYPLRIIDRPEELAEAIYQHVRSTNARKMNFKGADSHIDWAWNTLNPVTGCRHSCAYCYARHDAEGRGWAAIGYEQGFHPTFYPSRLTAFGDSYPTDKDGNEYDDIRARRVFIDSMSDLFGKWVPEWITQKVLDVAGSSKWVPMILTKFPKKVRGYHEGDEGLDLPGGAFVGVTVDGTNTTPAMVEEYIKDFQGTGVNVWLSVEPMLAPLHDASDGGFSEGFLGEYVDMVVIGGRRFLRGQEVPDSDEGLYGTLYKQDREWYQRPPLEDALALERRAVNEDVAVYWKSNMIPQQTPAAFK